MAELARRMEHVADGMRGMKISSARAGGDWRKSVLPVLSLALLLAGCSSFNRDWNKAGVVPGSSDSIAGRWDGRWLSTANGHEGKLRCLITRQTNDVLSARFQATYKRVLRFSYTVPLTVTRTNDLWQFHGSADLGALAGGIYHYQGTASSTSFHSAYASKFDAGNFEMRRVPAEISTVP